MMDKQKLNNLFWNYINNRITVSEKIEFIKIVFTPGYRKALYQALHELWDLVRIETKHSVDPASEHRIQKILSKINTAPQRSRFRWHWVAAACISVLAILTLWLQYPKQENVLRKRTYAITTLSGQKKAITLPDSTLVHLNAGSTLKYNNSYNLKDRVVELKGEAFFEVKRNADKPFVIQTNAVTTRVLGTSFNITAFDKEDIEITVASGKVQVDKTNGRRADKQETYMLTKGNKLTYDWKSRKITLRESVDLVDAFYWQSGVLVFDNESFENIAKKLQQWHDVQIQFENPQIKSCHFTGVFDNLPIRNVLDMLQLTMNFSYKIKGKTIKIDGPGCLN